MSDFLENLTIFTLYEAYRVTLQYKCVHNIKLFYAILIVAKRY